MSKIFAANFDFGTTETELADLFGRFGEVADVQFIRDDRGLFKGFAFVRMGDDEATRAAVSALDGSWFNGRKLRVRIDDSPARRATGHIRLIAQNGSFARIMMPDGSDVFMPAGQWRGSKTDTSLIGRAVEFEVSRGHRGLVARDVRAIDDAGEGRT